MIIDLVSDFQGNSMRGNPLQAGLDITSLNHGRMSQVHRKLADAYPRSFGVLTVGYSSIIVVRCSLLTVFSARHFVISKAFRQCTRPVAC